MKNYIGTKQIQAKPMNRLEYVKYRGWTLLEDEDGTDQGYFVEYGDDPSIHHNHEGYISWSPKKQFEEIYRETSGLNFGLALEAVKKGALIARSGWNGKGMFVFLRPEDTLNYDFIINKVKSLPESLKKSYQKIVDSGVNTDTQEHLLKSEVKFTAYLCMAAADGSIVNGWLASQTDMLADDWMIV